MTHASVQGKKRIMYWERLKPNPVNYASNCAGKPDWQKHHVIPCVSMKRSIKDAATSKPHLEKALKYFTKWNINEKPNLLLLPTRKVYQKAYGKKGGKQGVTKIVSNLPCHQPTSWGHTIYNDKVEKNLLNVWANVTITIKNHKLDANDVSGDIDTIRGTWEGRLTGGRVGSIQNWQAMMQGQAGAHNNFTMVAMPTSPI